MPEEILRKTKRKTKGKNLTYRFGSDQNIIRNQNLSHQTVSWITPLSYHPAPRIITPGRIVLSRYLQ